MRHALMSASLLAALAPAAVASVHVLNGGSGTALQSAVNAAADGDTILVHGGQFGTVLLVGRSLTLVAEPEQSAQIRGLVVSGVASTQRCVVAGFDVLST